MKCLRVRLVMLFVFGRLVLCANLLELLSDELMVGPVSGLNRASRAASRAFLAAFSFARRAVSFLAANSRASLSLCAASAITRASSAAACA
eukprot:CAMPEP_0119485520 /NCGR_PEP_ID=MMETSP1344-20130328/12205_1 /TAXON_ID=236787 /ORGANISM="Florenciella parvula, Strain CCMP2471" /LENGTH=90 /DNA_ID=CAMNT_0007520199 /DNA_START=87 /DNA_END=356 /DNA_ORIENTATION=-